MNRLIIVDDIVHYSYNCSGNFRVAKADERDKESFANRDKKPDEQDNEGGQIISPASYVTIICYSSKPPVTVHEARNRKAAAE
jgi:hypothetical protein